MTPYQFFQQISELYVDTTKPLELDNYSSPLMVLLCGEKNTPAENNK